jgi:hypothetical protein
MERFDINQKITYSKKGLQTYKFIYGKVPVMLKKQRIMLILGLCMIPLFAGLYGIHMYEDRNTDTAVAGPAQEGILLAYIDGEPYYYDPVYIFKLIDGAFLEEPDVEDKKKALFSELAYLQSVSDGNTVSQDEIEIEIERRKYNVANWDDVLVDEEESLKETTNGNVYDGESLSETKEEFAFIKQYVTRYYELWSECTEGEGIDEDAYWQINRPYFKKGLLILTYYSQRFTEYVDMAQNGECSFDMDYFSGEYVMKEFADLVEKYQVEIVDADLKEEIA